MRFSTLSDWLDWQQSLHPKEIELGLERVSTVAQSLDLLQPAQHIITVAGTNGKGSTVAYYSHLIRAAGYSVGTYTSPHLLRYNERISINNQSLDDEAIVQAFAAIDDARGDISLTYFEFSTLAALYCFKQQSVDYAVLEVGLGGRLDAVNTVDADLVHFTPIGIDHTDWLGDSREQIALEKAGVLRQGCQVVCNDANPPKPLVQSIKKHQAQVVFINKDFKVQDRQFYMGNISYDLSRLNLVGQHQQANCAGVLAGLHLLKIDEQLSSQQVSDCLQQIQLVGRYQTIKQDKQRQIIVDVGHNADAAQAIAVQLAQQLAGKVVLILGMLQDKNIEQFVQTLAPHIDLCVCIGLPGVRGLTAEALAERVRLADVRTIPTSSMEDAMQHANNYLQNQYQAVSSASAQDIILITGSFLTVEAYLKYQ